MKRFSFLVFSSLLSLTQLLLAIFRRMGDSTEMLGDRVSKN